MSKEAMEQALEALERVDNFDDFFDLLSPELSDFIVDTVDVVKEALANEDADAEIIKYHEATIARLQEALAKQEQRSVSEHTGEPVAWYVSNNGDPISEPTFDRNEAEQILAGQIEDCGSVLGELYTTPQQRTWVGLTVEEWKEIFLTTNIHTLPSAIEAKLKEKNGG